MASDPPGWVAARGALFAQAALFEVVFGLWLVFKARDIASRAGTT